MSEESFVLVFKKVWNILLVFLTANTTFTTVAGNKLSAAGKTIDREKAVVGTALAARHGRFETKLVDLVDREHRAFLSGIMISGNECGTKRTQMCIRDRFSSVKYSTRRFVNIFSLSNDRNGF